MCVWHARMICIYRVVECVWMCRLRVHWESGWLCLNEWTASCVSLRMSSALHLPTCVCCIHNSNVCECEEECVLAYSEWFGEQESMSLSLSRSLSLCLGGVCEGRIKGGAEWEGSSERAVREDCRISGSLSWRFCWFSGCVVTAPMVTISHFNALIVWMTFNSWLLCGLV